MCIHEVHAQKHKHARCIYDWSHIFAGLSLNFDRPGSRRVISPSSCTGAHSRVAGRSRRTRFVRDERNGPMKDTELAGQGAAAWPAGRRTRPETKRAGPAGNGAGPTGNGAGPTGNGAGLAGNGAGLAGNGAGPTGKGAGLAGNGAGPAGNGAGTEPAPLETEPAPLETEPASWESSRDNSSVRRPLIVTSRRARMTPACQSPFANSLGRELSITVTGRIFESSPSR